MVADLPRLEARLDIAFELANPDAIDIASTEADPMAFRLRGELVRLSLFEGFDELLCLPGTAGCGGTLVSGGDCPQGTRTRPGPRLLADEVGLGKTIEAGMVLTEKMLRGMAERVLILTPASLVGQWRDEMASKFGIEFATSHDPSAAQRPCGVLGPTARNRLDSVGAPTGAGPSAYRLRVTMWWWSTRPITCAIRPVRAIAW